jgi:hypothetical protein
MYVLAHIHTPRKDVELETPFAFGERHLFVKAKALTKTLHILTRVRTKGNLAGNGLHRGVIKRAALLEKRIQGGILHDFTVATQNSEAYTEVFDVLCNLLDKLEDIVILHGGDTAKMGFFT